MIPAQWEEHGYDTESGVAEALKLRPTNLKGGYHARPRQRAGFNP